MPTSKLHSTDLPERKHVPLDDKPWWQYGHLWMVIAGPVAAVVVGVAMVAAALSVPDPLVATDYYRRGIEINQTLAAEQRLAAERGMQPALQGRNHAASAAPGEQ